MSPVTEIVSLISVCSNIALCKSRLQRDTAFHPPEWLLSVLFSERDKSECWQRRGEVDSLAHGWRGGTRWGGRDMGQRRGETVERLLRNETQNYPGDPALPLLGIQDSRTSVHNSKIDKSQKGESPRPSIRGHTDASMWSVRARTRPSATSRSEAPAPATPRTDPEHTRRSGREPGTRGRKGRESTCVKRPEQSHPRTGRRFVGTGG